MVRTSRRAWVLSLVAHLVSLALLSLYPLHETGEVPAEPIHVFMWESLLTRPQVRAQRWLHDDEHPELSSPIVSIPTQTMSAVRLNPQVIPSQITSWYAAPGTSHEVRLAAPTAISQPSSARVSVHSRPMRTPTVRVEPVIRHPPRLEVLDMSGQKLQLPSNPLERIALDAIYTQGDGKLDLIFLIDASQSMENNIRAINRYLDGMISRLSESDLDVQIGVVAFRYSRFFSLMGWDVEVHPLTSDFRRVKRVLARIECVGGERTLDAILIALKRMKFRTGSERRLVLLTDEYVSGEVTRASVFQEIERAAVRVDVIGRDEPFQRRLASFSNGLWQSILDIH